MDAEIRVAAATAQPRNKASMRPRPNGRGNRGKHTQTMRRNLASMRPRPNGRGNIEMGRDAVVLVKLQ